MLVFSICLSLLLSKKSLFWQKLPCWQMDRIGNAPTLSNFDFINYNYLGLVKIWAT